MTKGFREFFREATRLQLRARWADALPLPGAVRRVGRASASGPGATGAGKTATAVLGWLWRLLHSGKPTPRRLVYCLPMRVLVEQSVKETRAWVGNIGRDIAVSVLMGGVDTDEWYLYPERPTVLIGTQDMLLSRALNRGYAASRFHWPIDFGLLNNDCLWVFDEPQLMGCGVATSAQLAGIRASFGTFGPCPSIWMSATLEPAWLDTVDFAGRCPAEPHALTAEDYDPGFPLQKRMTASKLLQPLGMTAGKQAKEIARAAVERHVAGTQTLVIVNTVERAKELYELIKKDKKAPRDVLLAHSRFRPAEREPLNERLTGPGVDRIIVATQVVEAGVDISARTLFVDLAPWASIVQRIGRCNRTGDDGPGGVFWIDLDAEKQAAPYESADLAVARGILLKLADKDVSPKALDDFKRSEHIKLAFNHKHVLRRRDLLDLFDTAPDLSGSDIDVQRFVRGADKSMDVQFFWRSVPDTTGPKRDVPAPQRRELCAVPIGQAREFLASLSGVKRAAGYVWDHLDGRWVSVDPRSVRPGLTIMLPESSGGYLAEYGWNAESKVPVTAVVADGSPPPEATASDPNSGLGVALSIAEHTRHVRKVLGELLADGGGFEPVGNSLDHWVGDLAKATIWHDVGKALPVAQKALYDPQLPDPTRFLAKSGRRGRLDYAKHGRRQFRHELGSALALLQVHPDWPFAVAYLVAAHHGRVRLSIRALPGEDPPSDESILYALGIRSGDVVPDFDLVERERCPGAVLELAPMRMGGDLSWTARALNLLAEIGPFRLAYLEMILRAADVRASRQEAQNA